MAKVTLTPEERQARLNEAGRQLASAVESIVTGEDWQQALSFASRLHHYSARNVFLLSFQCAERGISASYVAGYRTWQSLGRQVRKGEKGLAVLAPCTYKSTDEETGEDVYRVRGFRIEHVFADSQTDGDAEVPTRPRPVLLTGDGPEGLWTALAKLVADSGFQLVTEHLDGPNGRTDYTTRVVSIGDHLEPAAAVKTLAHEVAHVMLHDGFSGSRDRAECEAESVAYLVLDAFGIGSDDYSFPYVAGWSEGKSETVSAALDTAKKCAGEILDQLSA